MGVSIMSMQDDKTFPTTGAIDFAAYEREAQRLRAQAVAAMVRAAWRWVTERVHGVTGGWSVPHHHHHHHPA